MITIPPPKDSHVKGMQILFLPTKESKSVDSPSCTLEGEFTQNGEYEKTNK